MVPASLCIELKGFYFYIFMSFIWFYSGRFYRKTYTDLIEFHCRSIEGSADLPAYIEVHFTKRFFGQNTCQVNSNIYNQSDQMVLFVNSDYFSNKWILCTWGELGTGHNYIFRINKNINHSFLFGKNWKFYTVCNLNPLQIISWTILLWQYFWYMGNNFSHQVRKYTIRQTIRLWQIMRIKNYRSLHFSIYFSNYSFNNINMS